MIVKNEAHIISRCLESVKPLLQTWVIEDTGSTDNTEAVVEDVYKDLFGLYHYADWIDFSTNRNHVLEIARAATHCDYILIMDADDYLVFDDISVFDNLTAPAYSIMIKHGSISYPRPQLISTKIAAEYVGVLHEYLDLKGTPCIPLEKCHIIYGAAGSRSKDPEKYIKDAKVFEKALETDPNNARYTFYCAQSYRDAGYLSKALDYYGKRVCMGGPNDEQFVAALENAKIMELLVSKGDLDIETDDIAMRYIEASVINPSRNEAIIALSKLWRKRDMWEYAYFYATQAAKFHKPIGSLFLEDACYDWMPYDEMAVSGWYIGKKRETISLNKYLLSLNCIPQDAKDRIEKNLAWCQEHI